MSQSTQPVTYRYVLSLPGAAYAFSIAVLGRLAYGTISLPLLFTIQQATGSFGITGIALGAFGIATLTAPLKSRLMDRHGQPMVLSILGCSFPIPLVVLALLADSLAGSSALLVGLAALAGLATPPLGPAMRFLWSQIAVSPALRQRAYGMDSVVEESLYTVGPAIAGGLIALGRPDIALLLTAGLAVVGTVGLATSSAARTHGGPRPVEKGARIGLGPLRVRAFLSILIAVVGVGLALGLVEIAVAASAQQAGDPGYAGYVLAALALGSVMGGLLWGRATHRRQRSTQLLALMTVFALGIAAASVTQNLIALAVALFAAGLGLSPVFIVSYLTSDDLVVQSQRTEATTWINTFNNFGWSGGAAVAGWVLSNSTLQLTFLVGALILALATAIVALDRRAINTQHLGGRA